MEPFPVVVVGASAGGVEALRGLVSGLPPDLPAAVVVVLHIPRTAPSALATILDRSGPLPARQAEDGMPLGRGVVHVAPADHHVLVEDGELSLSVGPAENGHRPAIDPLFRSAALARGRDVIGVVLSGTRDDGAAGLAEIVAHGGTAVIQDPDDAAYAGMPENARRQVPDALVLPVADMGAAVAKLVHQLPGGRPTRPVGLAEAETEQVRSGHPTTDRLHAAHASELTCPDCHGVLFELPGPPAPRFRCRVGHAWSPDSLESAQADGVEEALWVAVRTLEERAGLADRLATDAQARQMRRVAEDYRARAATARAQADQVRALLGEPGSPGDFVPSSDDGVADDGPSDR